MLQFVFNKHILDSMVGQRSEPESEDDLIKRMPEAKSCSLQILGLSPSPGCRYMYDSIEGKVLSFCFLKLIIGLNSSSNIIASWSKHFIAQQIAQ